MDKFLEFLKEFNLQTIISMIAVMWYFSRHIEAKIEKIEEGLKVQSARTDRLYEMFIDLLKNKP